MKDGEIDSRRYIYYTNDIKWFNLNILTDKNLICQLVSFRVLVTLEMATGLQTTKSITNLTHDMGCQKNKKPIAKVNKLDFNQQMF